MTPTVVTYDIYSCSTASLTESTVIAGSEQGLIISNWQDAASTNPVTDPTSVLAGTYYIKGINSVGCSSVKPVIATIEATPSFITANPEMKGETETIEGFGAIYGGRNLDFSRVDFEEQFTGHLFNRNLPTGESAL